MTERVRVRIGVLGAARIVRHVIVDPARRLGGIDLVALASRDVAKGNDAAVAYGFAKCEPSYEALLARDDLDLVYVPLVNSEHALWSIAALQAGHAVLCEKPMALNAAQSRTMVAAANAAQRPLIEGFHYRHHALMHWLVDEVRAGWLGRIERVDGVFVADHPLTDRTRWGADLGGGALLDLGCYPLHAMRTLFGEPEIVTAWVDWADGVDATMNAELRFGDIAATLECSLAAGRRAADLIITGEQGRIAITNFVAPQLPHNVAITRNGITQTHQFNTAGSFDAQLMHVSDVVAGRAEPITGGRDAIANMVAIDAIFAAARGHGV
jgi:predicted dehydrogenase